VGLAWSHYPERYAGGSLACDRVFHAVQVKVDEPDEKGYPGPLRGGLDVGLTTSPRKKFDVAKTSNMSGMGPVNGRREEDREGWRRLLREAREQNEL
jgi:hypothetical protein